MADDNSSFGQLVQGSEQGVTAPTNAGLDQGMSLAKTAQDMQMKQQQSQEMEQKLNDMKWTSAKGLMNNYISASDPVRRAMKPQVQKRFGQMGLDPHILSSLDDEDMRVNYKQALDAYSSHPDAAASGLQMLTNVNAFENGIGGLSQELKQRAQMLSSENIKQAQMANQRYMNENTVSGRIEAANVVGGTRKENMLRAEAGRFHNDSRIKQFSNQIDMIDNIKGILANPNLTNQEFNDAQIEISNAIAGARGAALGKLERTEYDTYEQHLQDLKQRITGNPQDAVPAGIRKQFNELVRKTQDSFLQHRAMRAKGLLRTSDNDQVMQTQHEAMQPYLNGDEGGHENEVNAEGRDMSVKVKPASSAEAMGNPQFNEQERAAYQAAVSAGHNPAEVSKRIMQRRGGQ